MPEINEFEAHIHLDLGALGIGEDHTDKRGRALALKLINSGKVRHLFVELPETEWYSKQLREARILAADGSSLSQVSAKAPSQGPQCDIPQGRVIARALQKGVRVHLADHGYAQTHPFKHEPRHRKIRDKFIEVTGAVGIPPNAVGDHAKGCLLLWGAAHFEKDTSLDNFIIGLPFVKLG